MLAALFGSHFDSIRNFLDLPSNSPFTVALGILIFLFAVELVALLMSFSPSHFLDSLIPDFDAHWADWLHLGKVPLFALLSIFLFAFSMTGLGVQALSITLIGAPIALVLTTSVASLIGVLAMHFIGNAVGRLIPTVETYAVSTESFIGRVGNIVTGDASAGSPSELKLKDEFGNMHYMMVEPVDPSEVLEEGCAVKIVCKDGSLYKGAKAL